MSLPKEIFKAYDIRGIVGKTLTPEIVEAIGQAIGSEAAERKQKQIVIGYDGRLSGPELAAALARGIQKTGLDVIDIGMVATPMVYFAAHHLNTGCGVMVTGSHNPPDYNGLKMVLAGETLSGETIQKLRERIEHDQLITGQGTYSKQDISQAYIDRIASDIRLARPMKIAVDAGNGVAGAYAGRLFRALGCDVQELYCEVDGHFPHHHPDPSVPENLEDLIAALRQGDAEIGLAFDGDGDRLGVVTKDGAIIYPDRQLMLFAEDVLHRVPGATIIFDVKSTRNLTPWISSHGGEPLLWKTGLYAGCRLLEILSRHTDPSAVLNGLPDSVSTPEQHIQMREGEPHALIARLQKEAHFEGAQNIVSIDGLRVEYADGFGLMRPSNTTPVVVLRFEANDAQALKRIQEQFRTIILAAAPDVKLPF
jgi:phosphomannomutase/phosphoglucomutase